MCMCVYVTVYLMFFKKQNHARDVFVYFERLLLYKLEKKMIFCVQLDAVKVFS